MYPVDFDVFKKNFFNQLTMMYPNINWNDETSVVKNQILNPLLSEFEKVYKDYTQMFNNIENLMYNNNDYASGETLDFIASLYGLKRNPGSKTRGLLSVYIPFEFYPKIEAEGSLIFSDIIINIEGKQYIIPKLPMTISHLNTGVVHVEFEALENGSTILGINKKIKFALNPGGAFQNTIEVNAQILDVTSGEDEETDENFRKRINNIKNNIYLVNKHQLIEYFKAEEAIKAVDFIDNNNIWNLKGIISQYKIDSTTGEILSESEIVKVPYGYELKIQGPVITKSETKTLSAMTASYSIDITSRSKTVVSYLKNNISRYTNFIDPFYAATFLVSTDTTVPVLTNLKYVEIEGPLLFPLKVLRLFDNKELEYGKDFITVVYEPANAFTKLQKTIFIFRESLQSDIQIEYVSADFNRIEELLKKLPFVANATLSYFNPIMVQYTFNSENIPDFSEFQRPDYTLTPGIDIPSNYLVLQTMVSAMLPTGGITPFKPIPNTTTISDALNTLGIVDYPPYKFYTVGQLLGGGE